LAAATLGLDIHQPVALRRDELGAWLEARKPDVALVLAYGRILPGWLLQMPAHGCMNLHASLLPKYRGAAPIQWSIVNGESETGVSLMQMDEGLDTGPVWTMRSLAIQPEETAGELSQRISQLAALMVRQDLPRALAGELDPRSQDSSRSTFAPRIRPEHALVDWRSSAAQVARLIRGLLPRPGAYTTVNGKRLRLLDARPLSMELDTLPGQVSVASGQRVFIQTGGGGLELLRAQMEGRNACSARELLNGRLLYPGVTLGVQ
jgi:methionyl-tRNA formyltransferase